MYPEADVEKTQAPMDPSRSREFAKAEKQLHDQIRGNSRFADCETARPLSEAEILAELFRYHAPTEVTIPKFAAINQAAKNFAEIVLQNCPHGADRSAAIDLIRDARMKANAAISLNGLSLY